MVQPAPSERMTVEQYLAWEREQPERHHFARGEVFAMAGESPRHSLLASRWIAHLAQALAGGPCDVHTSDLRLGLGDEQLIYADVTVVCRPLQLREGTSDVVTNPRVVVEVLSRRTERYDRGDKQAGYLALPSLSHYVLVAQRRARVEVYERTDDGAFRFTVSEAGATVRIPSLGLKLAIDALYDGAFELPGDD